MAARPDDADDDDDRAEDDDDNDDNDNANGTYRGWRAVDEHRLLCGKCVCVYVLAYLLVCVLSDFTRIQDICCLICYLGIYVLGMQRK